MMKTLRYLLVSMGLIMNRKSTKNTRGPNADEKKFQGFVKEHYCIWCGNDGPSIVDHAKGSCFKHNKVLIGHWFVLPCCVTCDAEKTIRGKRQGNESLAWINLIKNYSVAAPDDVYESIKDWDK